jgi:hypothetical protein
MVGKWYVESRYLQACSPHLCLLRTDGLSPRASIECTDRMLVFMGPSSLVTDCQRMFGFLHCIIGWLGRETGYVPSDWLADVLWIMSGTLFLGSSDSLQHCWWLVKSCYMWTTWDMYDPRPYADWAWKVCGMLVRFSPAWCTSIRLTATLRYE